MDNALLLNIYTFDKFFLAQFKEFFADVIFEVIYAQICWAFDEMVEQGVDFTYYFVGEGVLDAECIFEILLC